MNKVVFFLLHNKNLWSKLKLPHWHLHACFFFRLRSPLWLHVSAVRKIAHFKPKTSCQTCPRGAIGRTYLFYLGPMKDTKSARYTDRKCLSFLLTCLCCDSCTQLPASLKQLRGGRIVRSFWTRTDRNGRWNNWGICNQWVKPFLFFTQHKLIPTHCRVIANKRAPQWRGGTVHAGLMEIYSGGMAMLSLSVGYRTGLLDKMLTYDEPKTCAEVARDTGLKERWGESNGKTVCLCILLKTTLFLENLSLQIRSGMDVSDDLSQDHKPSEGKWRGQIHHPKTQTSRFFTQQFGRLPAPVGTSDRRTCQLFQERRTSRFSLRLLFWAANSNTTC